MNSVNMRNTSQSFLVDMDISDQEEEEVPLLGNVQFELCSEKQMGDSWDIRLRTFYNNLKRVFVRLPREVRQFVAIYLLAIHFLLLLFIIV